MAADCTLGRVAGPAGLYARPVRTLTIAPRGPFDLATARDFAGGFPAGLGASAAADGAILMTFPVEGWTASAVVQVSQTGSGTLSVDVFGGADVEQVRRQVARSLSLDHDGAGWPSVGAGDPVIGALQARYGLLRPVCFYSAYEAATSFVIGQRISMTQTRRVKERLAGGAGDPIDGEDDGPRQAGAALPPPPGPPAPSEIPGGAPGQGQRPPGPAPP